MTEAHRTSKTKGQRKRRRIVEYRWFPATPESGLLGGVVASSRATAEHWMKCELGENRPNRSIVRVRMEYEI